LGELEKRYNFDEAWELRCAALAEVSKHVAGVLERAAEKGKIVAIPARVSKGRPRH